MNYEQKTAHIPLENEIYTPWWDVALNHPWVGLIIPAIIIWYFKERISLMMKKRYDRWKKKHDNGEQV